MWYDKYIVLVDLLETDLIFETKVLNVVLWLCVTFKNVVVHQTDKWCITREHLDKKLC